MNLNSKYSRATYTQASIRHHKVKLFISKQKKPRAIYVIYILLKKRKKTSDFFFGMYTGWCRASKIQIMSIYIENYYINESIST